MMACPDWKRLESRLADLGEQSPTEFHSLASHLEQCPACKQTFEGLLQDDETARWQQLGPTPPPAAAPSTTGVGATRSDLDGGPRYPFAPPAQEDHLGALGEYQVVALLGRGAMGTVFKAFDLSLRRWVALKIPRPELGESSEFR